MTLSLSGWNILHLKYRIFNVSWDRDPACLGNEIQITIFQTMVLDFVSRIILILRNHTNEPLNFRKLLCRPTRCSRLMLGPEG